MPPVFAAIAPHGFDPAAAEHDAMICELVRQNRLEALTEISAGVVERPAPTAGGRC